MVSVTPSRAGRKPALSPIIIPWLLSGSVAFLAIFDWASSLGWQFANMSIYLFFPVLGLLAFSIMWSHYIAGFMHRTFLKDKDLKDYFRTTGYVVLVLLLLHPGLLAYQRFRDGFGLPPGSETGYVAPTMAWIVVVGMVSLFVFLAYELKRWYEERSWWKYIAGAGDIAMIAIFYHGLQLGSQLHGGWFKIVWWFYGICLVAVIAHKYMHMRIKSEY